MIRVFNYHEEITTNQTLKEINQSVTSPYSFLWFQFLLRTFFDTREIIHYKASTIREKVRIDIVFYLEKC
jgi:hypothetical protein